MPSHGEPERIHVGGMSVLQDGSVSVERKAGMGQLIWGDRDTWVDFGC